MNTPDHHPVLTPAKVAGLLGPGWNEENVADLMRTGQLKSVRIGVGRTKEHRRTSRAWLDEFLRGQTVGTTPPTRPVRTRPSPVRGLEWAGPARC